MLHVILGGAFGTLISSAQVFSGSVQAVFNGGGGPNMLGGLGEPITGAAAGGLLGGPAGAVAGALSGGMQRASDGANSMASLLTTGMLSAAGLQAISGGSPSNPQGSTARGDVFRPSGAGQLEEPLFSRPGCFPTAFQLPADGEEQSKTNLFMPGPAEADASLQTLAGREGWQGEQVEMVKAAARRGGGESGAVHSLMVSPGFERSTPETIQRALRAAHSITSDSAPDTRAGTEQA